MYQSFLIHLSTHGHLGGFHVLAIINSAVMNIGVHVSLSLLVSSVCMLSSGIAGSSDQISHSAVSDSLQPHESQHARSSCPFTNSQSSLRLTSIEAVMPSSHLILCRPLLLLPPIPRSIRVFSNESTLCMRWPKYWSFSFSIIPSKEIQG